MNWLTIIAAAGGGSSGFGGGGGGGGGGGFSGGGSSFSGGGSAGGGDTVVGVIILVVIGVALLALFIAGWIAARRIRRRRRERVERVRLASAEAATDDPAFAHDVVEPAAAQLFTEIQHAWDARDHGALAARVAPELFEEWKLRLDDFEAKGWHNRVTISSTPEIEYVGLVNRADDAEDRAVVRIEATLEDYVETSGGAVIHHTGKNTKVAALAEYWQLGKRDGRWTLLSIEQDAEGLHNLDAEIVASPWADSRVADEALVEIAVADKLPAGFTTADVADLDFEGTAREAALDLSLADARFAPDVLEAAARRAVAAWAEAVDGDDAALEAIASPEAVAALLYGGDAARATRVVVRGPRVRRITIEALDAAADPAAMTIAVELGGARYVEDRATAAVLSGSKQSMTLFRERWRLALDGADSAPWRLVDSAAPAPTVS